jgi:fluoride ion exporter CrcB/FEX
MGEIIIEIVGEIILMFLFNYPGAGVRWLISRLWGSKKTFKDFAKGDIYLNGSVGIITMAILIALIMYLIP